MRPPVALVGVITMTALVTVSSVMVYVTTKQHAEDSIDEVSKRFADAKMERAVSEIRYKLQHEPVDAIMSSKSDIEAGLLRFDSPREVWMRRASHFFTHTGVFTLYMALAANRDAGLQYGMGFAVDAAGGVIYINDPPVTHFYGPYDSATASYNDTFISTVPVNLSTRAYVSIFSEPGDVSLQLANEPLWTDILVSVNPRMDNGGGLFISLSAPVFETPTPREGELIGVTVVSVYLSLFSLEPYLLSDNSHLIILDAEELLVSSTSLPVPYFEEEGGDLVRHTLLSAEIPLYSSLHRALPDLLAMANDDEHFSKFDHDGDTYWLEVRTVYHSNLRWYLVGVIPESEFFQRIYDSNRQSLTVVIVLIVSSAVIAALAICAFSTSLTRLALAFDRVSKMDLDHADIKVGKSHWLYELNSLHKGFGHAVDMVRQVQTFLPTVDVSDESASDRLTATDLGTPSGTQRSGRSHGSNNRPAKAQGLSVGLRASQHAVGMTVNVRSFTNMCHTNIEDAVVAHRKVFSMTADEAKAHKGVVSCLEGDRVILTWNTAKPCPPSTSRLCSMTLALELYREAKDVAQIDIGVHIGYTFHGILGGAQQRFNAVGSSLVDGATHLAMNCPKVGLSPSIIASEAVVDGLHDMSTHHVDNVETYAETLRAYWVRAKVHATDEEWMYQLSQRENNREAFLDPYWGAMKKGDLEGASSELAKFKQANPLLQTLAAKLAGDLQLQVNMQNA